MPLQTLLRRRKARIALGALIGLVFLGGLIVLLRTPGLGPSPAASPTRAELIDSGRVAFRSCSLCHGREGQGERCPPLIYSDFVQGDTERLIRFVLRPGDSVRVNGVLWRSHEMPSLDNLSDFEIASVLTYIRSLNDSLITCTPESVEAGTWAECTTRPRPGDELAADSIHPDQVAAVRASLPAL